VDQFQKKTWANKLELWRKLYSLRLKEGQSVQKPVNAMTGVLDSLYGPMEEEDCVVHLLANMLVTALEANSDVSTSEIVTERLSHEERKKGRKDDEMGNEKERAPQSKRSTINIVGK
jgi:hypothetical protein